MTSKLVFDKTMGRLCPGGARTLCLALCGLLLGICPRAVAQTMTAFDAPWAGANALCVSTVAQSINPQGAIVGWYVDENCHPRGFLRAADGTFTKVDVPSGDTTLVQRTVPTSINAEGTVAGYYVEEYYHAHVCPR